VLNPILIQKPILIYITRTYFRWFRDAGSAHSVHRPSLWPARLVGTLYQTAWEIRILAGTASDVCWRHNYVHCTETFYLVDVFQDDTLYKLTYLFIYLLTYLKPCRGLTHDVYVYTTRRLCVCYVVNARILTMALIILWLKLTL